MKFLDFFAGIGGFRMGLENAGHTCVGHVEIDKYAQKAYDAIYQPKGEYFAEDITRIEPNELPEADMYCGGFPCQSFSVAGKRGGFNDTRGTLFFEVARLAKTRKPTYLLLENVKGLLSHDKGKTFETIIATLDELGYDAEWQVLNSKNYCVPQNRERVFIIGRLRGRSTREIFPIDTSNKQAIGLQGQQNTINTIRARYTSTGTGSYVVEREQHEKEIKQVGNIDQHKRKRKNPQTGRVYDPSGISPCLSTMQGGGLEPKIIQPVLTPNRLNKRQNGRRMKDPGEPMFTLTGQDIHGVMLQLPRGHNKGGIHNIAPTLSKSSYEHNNLLVQGVRIRRLTPLECWRLQGFPDWAFKRAWLAGISDTQLYKMAGNAVTVNVTEAIGREMRGVVEV